jgi:surface antigen
MAIRINHRSPQTGENRSGPAIVRRHPARVLGALALLVLSAQVLAGGLMAAPANAQVSPNLGSQLNAGATMTSGQYLQSPNGQYTLQMQGSDGNLVEYNAAGAPLWDPPPPTQTGRHPGAYAVLQGDGNFVVYPAGSGTALWASYTQNNPGDHLSLQDDGNLVIYSAAGAPLWATMSSADPRGRTGTTNSTYAQGECTWYADQEAHLYTGVWLPNYLGNAGQWAASAASNGWATGSTPRIGSVLVIPPGQDGAGSVGHVAWVTEVYPSQNAIQVTEMNWNGNAGDSRRISPAFGGVYGFRYIYMNP